MVNTVKNSVFNYKHLHQTTDTTNHEPPTAFLKTFCFTYG